MPLAVTSLAAERELLDSVRAQISGGHFLRAFELTEAHLKRFPAGKLAEEREVMAIMALAKMGEGERANLRAERFQQDYPRSFFTQVIEAALGGSP